MRLGLVLGYGNAFGVEAVQWGRGGTPPPSSDSLAPGPLRRASSDVCVRPRSCARASVSPALTDGTMSVTHEWERHVMATVVSVPKWERADTDRGPMGRPLRCPDSGARSPPGGRAVVLAGALGARGAWSRRPGALCFGPALLQHRGLRGQWSGLFRGVGPPHAIGPRRGPGRPPPPPRSARVRRCAARGRAGGVGCVRRL